MGQDLIETLLYVLLDFPSLCFQFTSFINGLNKMIVPEYRL
jgi:hypothetical protein